MTLTSESKEIYLLDPKTGIGFTWDKATSQLIHATQGTIADYTVVIAADGSYTVKYGENVLLPDDKDRNIAYPLTVGGEIATSFKIPKGTMITMIDQIDSNTPTYWYYSCNTETTESDLTDFTQMNSNKKYSFENASGGKVSNTASQRVTENLSFIFDFSKTDLSGHPESYELKGNLRLLHRHQSGELKLTKVKVENGSYSKDTFDVSIEVAEDITRCGNTRYAEREYSVLLELDEKDSEGNKLSFPAGTTFRFGDELLELEEGNKAVVVPIKDKGVHTVTMETSMEGFTAGIHTLKATVYSSQDAYFRNELDTGKETIIPINFDVGNNPKFSLSVEQDTHLYSSQDVMHLVLKTKSEATDADAKITVKLFKYNRSDKNYTLIPLTDVFSNPSDEITVASDTAGVQVTDLVMPVGDSVSSGTYRMEFRYHNKTEYWDFIIKKSD